jgi:hypothetical protein
VNDATNFTFNEIKSKRSSPLLSTLDIENKSSDYQSQKSEIILPFHSATILSPIEEESEEIETTNGIAFSLINQDSSTKKYSIDEKDKISDFITIDDAVKPSEKLSALQQMPSSSSTMVTSPSLQPVEVTHQQKIDENNQVKFQFIIKLNHFVFILDHYYYFTFFSSP